MKIQCQQYTSQNGSKRLKVRENLQIKSICQDSRLAYPYHMFLYKFSSESPTQGSIAVCTQPSCVGLNQASQLFSWIASSVDNLSTPWDLVWEAKCGIKKVCHFQMSSSTTKARFWFLKGTHVLQLATHWVRQKPFPVKGELPTIWCPQNTTILDVLWESAIHAELI